MSRSTFTSPVATNNHSKSRKTNLLGLLENKLNQHNNKVNNQPSNSTAAKDSNLRHFASQFEKLQKKRRISYGDKAPTPSNSPAIHQSLQSQNPSLRAISKNKLNNKQRLISPLHLSLSRKISSFTATPPVTPECHNNNQGTKNPTPVASIRRQSTSSSSSSLLLSPDARVMFMHESSHNTINPLRLSLGSVCSDDGDDHELKIERERFETENLNLMDIDGGNFGNNCNDSDHEYKYNKKYPINIMPHNLYDDTKRNIKQQRLRSLSCSETMLMKQTKIMSPRLSAIPHSPILKPISNKIRKYSFGDPTPLMIPPSPKSPTFISRKSSSITPHGKDNENELSSKFDKGLELNSFADMIMDD